MHLHEALVHLHTLRTENYNAPETRAALDIAISALVMRAACTCSARDRRYGQDVEDDCACSAKRFDGTHTTWCPGETHQ